ncbi:MAG: sigma-54-dependent Fis family transcriptional regulator [Bacteroidetes bacterium]|nr:sigma-54-dependent Fis family transcriptional regulator [Bacteroidota bacterium]
MNTNILIADDEEQIREPLSFVLNKEGYNCKTVNDGSNAIKALQEDNYDILITDIKMPGMNGVEVLEKSREISPETIVILITAYGSVETAIQALRKGAADYLLKPLDFDEVLVRLKNLIRNKELFRFNKILRKQINTNYNFENIIGKSSVMKKIFEMVKQVSEVSTNILITGATGTGKELIARAIHNNGNRKDKPFIPVNCGAIPDNLYESEFFGYKKGAFTGADTNYEGLFKSADSGTIFLDEIAELPEHMQVKLNRVLQEREIKPIGSSFTIKIDVRILAATNKNLEEEVKSGSFREDLFYRINVVELKLPSLAERKDDVPLLVDHFINKYNSELNKSIIGIDNEVIKLFMSYDWKGNLRELENMIERAVLLCQEDIITPKYLPSHIFENKNELYTDNLSEAIETFEQNHINEIIKRTEGNKTEAAKLLGVDPSTLYRKMSKNLKK